MNDLWNVKAKISLCQIINQSACAGKGKGNMALLQLKNIGKIYVSDANVAVGIRGVNLSFESGEFVAVTGQSGSGKSTLLNVISGMDTYEEGELYIQDEPTSHYLQKDWEEYRKRYISFIFQEYNIIESFTVLQNVELALMNIKNTKERRKKALELIRRVGIEKHIHHKGSKLSGGQKQRTVIARALAKDSPIILADEPTGNLDSKSSEEIIELLREVSENKLVIIVTHNFEQVEKYATRHIRIFDGAVESDRRISGKSISCTDAAAEPVDGSSNNDAEALDEKRRSDKEIYLKRRKEKKKISVRETIHNGLVLGRVRFSATPKLTSFLCILMTLAMLIVTLMTSLTASSFDDLKSKTMFTHYPGRTIIARIDGNVITDNELESLASEVGAKSYMHHDLMLDRSVGIDIKGVYLSARFAYPADSVKIDVGRYPEKDNEVVLSVPLSLKGEIGEIDLDGENLTHIYLSEKAKYTITGINYYYDNTVNPRLLFTDNGYKTATALAFFADNSSMFSYEIKLSYNDIPEFFVNDGFMSFVDFELEPGTYAILGKSYETYRSTLLQNVGSAKEDVKTEVELKGSFAQTGVWGSSVITEAGSNIVSMNFDEYKLAYPASERMEKLAREIIRSYTGYSCIALSPDILTDFINEKYYEKTYTQASLFFESDFEAHKKADTLRERGYTAVPSDATVKSSLLEAIFRIVGAGFNIFGWALLILFTALFLNLCSSKAMNATKGDIAIMRSMGIPTGVVKTSIYVQTLMALIPAFIVTAITCTVIFMIPVTSKYFTYLHAREYILIAVVMALVAIRLSGKYVKKMFNQSVKKTLKGGSKQ